MPERDDRRLIPLGDLFDEEDQLKPLMLVQIEWATRRIQASLPDVTPSLAMAERYDRQLCALSDLINNMLDAIRSAKNHLAKPASEVSEADRAVYRKNLASARVLLPEILECFTLYRRAYYKATRQSAEGKEW
jgi:hypothetical protein